MAAYHDPHISEEMLERYALKQLSEAHLESLEEHLLICPQCQDRLDAVDEYIATMRLALVASKTVAPAAAGWPLWPRIWRPLAWACAVALIVIAVTTISWRQSEVPLSEIALIAPRGGDGLPIAHGRAGAPLLLHLDTKEIPPAGSYTLEVVDSGGRRLWRSSVKPDRNQIAVVVQARPNPGKYWVRLFDDPQHDLPIREYGVELQ